MESRSKGLIAIYRDHPDAETAKSLIYLRAVERDYEQEDIACIFSAPAGSKQEANAEFIVRAWNAYDGLVDAVRSALVAARAHQAGLAVNFTLLEAEMFAALVAAGVKP